MKILNFFLVFFLVYIYDNKIGRLTKVNDNLRYKKKYIDQIINRTITRMILVVRVLGRSDLYEHTDTYRYYSNGKTENYEDRYHEYRNFYNFKVFLIDMKKRKTIGYRFIECNSPNFEEDLITGVKRR